MENNNRSFSRKFLDWFYGISEQPSYFDAPPPEHVPAEPSAYPNRTIIQRYEDWRAQNGSAAWQNLYKTVSVITCIVITGVLLAVTSSLPKFGDPSNPANNEVPAKYIEDGVQDTGAVNTVAGMILDYRAFDTFGESCVLFCSACAVISLLRGSGERDEFDSLLQEMEDPRHDEILRQVARILVPMIMTFGIYVVFGGHLGPGGGFSGGAIIGAALILYASAFGTIEARRFYSYKTFCRAVPSALGFYAIAKGYSFYTGANHIDSGIPLGTPGNIFSAGLILPLNICVGLIVASVMYVFYILFSKGEMI